MMRVDTRSIIEPLGFATLPDQWRLTQGGKVIARSLIGEVRPAITAPASAMSARTLRSAFRVSGTPPLWRGPVPMLPLQPAKELHA